MTTKRIAPGYYIFTYKGQSVEICRTEMPEENYKTYWYCQINGAEANDYNSSKKEAIDAAVYMIDNANTYGIKLITK